MTCVHLRQLYELCDQNQLQFSSSDLVHIVCKQCQKEDVCPSMLVGDFSEQETEPEHADQKPNDQQDVTSP